MKAPAPSPAANALAEILKLGANVGTLVWRGPPADLNAAWQRHFGGPRPKPLAEFSVSGRQIALYDRGVFTVDGSEIRRLPGGEGKSVLGQFLSPVAAFFDSWARRAESDD